MFGMFFFFFMNARASCFSSFHFGIPLSLSTVCVLQLMYNFSKNNQFFSVKWR